MKSLIFTSLGVIGLTSIINAQPKPALDPILSSIIASGQFVEFKPTPVKPNENTLRFGESSISEFVGESFEHPNGVYGSLKVTLGNIHPPRTSKDIVSLRITNIKSSLITLLFYRPKPR